MTLPNERTWAVIQARDFLLRLSNVYVEGGIKGIRREVREEARRVLRHFPHPHDLGGKDSFDAAAVNEWYERYEPRHRSET
jgi:hypothetical protein